MFLCFVIDELLKAMARSIVFKFNYLRFLSEWECFYDRLWFYLTSIMIKKPISISGDSTCITRRHQTVSVVQCLMRGPDKQIPMV